MVNISVSTYICFSISSCNHDLRKVTRQLVFVLLHFEKFPYSHIHTCMVFHKPFHLLECNIQTTNGVTIYILVTIIIVIYDTSGSCHIVCNRIDESPSITITTVCLLVILLLYIIQELLVCFMITTLIQHPCWWSDGDSSAPITNVVVRETKVLTLLSTVLHGTLTVRNLLTNTWKVTWTRKMWSFRPEII
jgi:hypothetical protein